MSVWSGSLLSPLSGSEGELINIRVSVEPRLLERLLETLACLSFPVNPQILHAVGEDAVVEFPAYESRAPEVHKKLSSAGFPGSAVQVRPMLDELSAMRRT